MADGPPWGLIHAKRRLSEAQAKIARLQERIRHLEGMVLDLGGDP